MSELEPTPAHAANLPPSTSPRAPKGKHGLGAWIVALCVIAATVGAVVVYRRTTPEQTTQGRRSAPPAVVGATNAHVGDLSVYTNALGIVTPVYTVQVKSRVDGQLMSVNYVEGQMVHAGDSLVEIDPRPYQAQLTQMEGQLARDKALLENAHVDLLRYQAAYSSNAIPKQQLDTQVATVHQYEGTVQLDQGQVDNAKLQIIYSHITSPISGRVGLRLVDPGNIVHATDTNPLAVVAQLQPITIVFSVAEDALPSIQQQLHQGRTLVVEAYDRTTTNKLATGSLLTTDNQIDTTTGTIRLKAMFTNEDYSLFPNQFVNVKLLVATEHGVTLVPNVAIQRNGQGAFVYVIQDNQTNKTVTMRTVTLGATDGNVTVVKGLAPTENIAADGFNRLQEGQEVRLRGEDLGQGRGRGMGMGGGRRGGAEGEGKRGMRSGKTNSPPKRAAGPEAE